VVGVDSPSVPSQLVVRPRRRPTDPSTELDRVGHRRLAGRYRSNSWCVDCGTGDQGRLAGRHWPNSWCVDCGTRDQSRLADRNAVGGWWVVARWCGRPRGRPRWPATRPHGAWL